MTACDAGGIILWERLRFHPQAQCTHPKATTDTGKAEVATRTALGNDQVVNLVMDLPKSLQAHATTGADRSACLKRTDELPKPDEDGTTAIPAKVALLNSVYAFSIN